MEEHNITLLEPFYTGSHAAWADGLVGNSHHKVKLLSLPGRHWKWRMHGGAVELAAQFEKEKTKPDLILATNMLDLSVWLALTRRKTSGIPVAIYFHENQLTYPWSPNDPDPAAGRDLHYSFINYTSALAADRLLFNSRFHRDSFLAALPGFLESFPDYRSIQRVDQIAQRCEVLPLGLALRRFEGHGPQGKTGRQDPPLIIFNHRWEYDKNPEEFFEALFRLQSMGVRFRVAVVGQAYGNRPPIFDKAKKELTDKIVAFGYADNFGDYARLLWSADIAPVTSRQEFFGAAVAEAIYCGCLPLLPRRLAYPDMVPQARFGDFYYDDFEQLVDKLYRLCAHPGEERGMSLRYLVQKYDWAQMIEQYDEKLAEIASRYR